MTEERFTLALKLTKNAGKIIRNDFDREAMVAWKDDNTPVTTTGFIINKMIVEEIRKIFPNDRIITKEEICKNNNSDYTWAYDPLDGTTFFAHKIPLCGFMIAVIDKTGNPVIGIVNDPLMKRLIVAQKGKGAYLNKERISVSSCKYLNKGLIYTSFWHGAVCNIDTLNQFFIHSDLKTAISFPMITRTITIAWGHALASIYPASYTHDTAALKIIVEEAGGKVTDLFGHEQRYDQPIRGQLATNGQIHNELLELINKHL